MFSHSKKSVALRKRLLLPIVTIFVLQGLIYGGVFLYAFVLPEADSNACRIMQEQVANRAQQLETTMSNRWGNFSELTLAFVELVEDIIAEQEATVQDLATDSALGEKVVTGTAQSVIDLLRSNGVTGAFLVLDSPVADPNAPAGTFPGFYVRNLNPGKNHFGNNNSDLLMERGQPSLSRTLGIPLDSFWSAYYSFKYQAGGIQQVPINEQFFFHPMQVGEMDNASKTYAGFWSQAFKLNENDVSIITCSVPLVASDGTVLGVLGIDVTEGYLQENISYQEISANNTGMYLLAICGKKDGNFGTVCANGRAYQRKIATTGTLLQGEPTKYENMYSFELDGNTYYGSQEEIRLQPHNSPFANQRWVLLGMQPENELFAFSHRTKVAAFFTILGIAVLGAMAVLLANRMVLTPIQTVVEDLQKVTSANTKIKLRKTRIKEIDALTSAIDEMGSVVAESASKVSKIIDMAQVPVGVFEYLHNGVQCSAGFFRILGVDATKYPDQIVPQEQFEQIIGVLSSQRYKNETNLYKVDNSQQGVKWLQYIELDEQGQRLGTITDVTFEVEERLRIEYERDYDALSGIFNRRAFLSQAEAILSQGPTVVKQGLVLMADLDNLKYINDMYGHECGDRYIMAMANSMKLLEGDHGVIARRSGDEFVALLYGYDDQGQLREKIAQFWNDLRKATIELPTGNRYTLRASGGTAWYPQDSTSLNDLIQYADFAMYNVKHSQKGILLPFNQIDYNTNSFLLRGQEALNELLEENALHFVMQPILNVQEENVYGYEFLMRSFLPQFKSPLNILRMAAEQSSISQLEQVVWLRSMATYRRHIEQGNIAPNQFAFINSVANTYPDKATQKLLEENYSEHLSQVVLEMTEHEKACENCNSQKLAMMQRYGGQIAIDDYGTGYNGLQALLVLKPQIIKLDIALIKDLESDKSKQQLVQDTVSFAHANGILVIAEGVETRSEMEAAIRYGVDFLQGYYLARPSFSVDPIPENIWNEIRIAKQHRILPCYQQSV